MTLDIPLNFMWNLQPCVSPEFLRMLGCFVFKQKSSSSSWLGRARQCLQSSICLICMLNQAFRVTLMEGCFSRKEARNLSLCKLIQSQSTKYFIM